MTLRKKLIDNIVRFSPKCEQNTIKSNSTPKKQNKNIPQSNKKFLKNVPAQGFGFLK